MFSISASLWRREQSGCGGGLPSSLESGKEDKTTAGPPAGQARGASGFPSAARRPSPPHAATHTVWVGKVGRMRAGGPRRGAAGTNSRAERGWGRQVLLGEETSSRTKGRGQQPIACAKARVPKVVAPSLRLVMGPEGRGWVSGPPAGAGWPLGPGGPREPACAGRGQEPHHRSGKRGEGGQAPLPCAGLGPETRGNGCCPLDWSPGRWL